MSNDNQPSSILFADSQLMSAQLAELVSAVPASYYTRSELEQLAAALRELLGAVGRVRVRGARRPETPPEARKQELEEALANADGLPTETREELQREHERLRLERPDLFPAGLPPRAVTGADDAPPASTDPRHVGRVLAGLKR